MIRQPFKARTSEELMALLAAMATAVIAVIIVTMLYFGREIIIPIAMAILLSFVLDAGGPAHMRYSVRRLRRKLPKAVIVLVCAASEIDRAALQQLGDGAKADLVAASLGEAVQLCIEATGLQRTCLAALKDDRLPATTAA
jgi:hypothetical protein